MTHEKKIAQWIGSGKIGTEIGPGTSPVPGLDPAPIYVDCFKTFAATDCRADFYGHACACPFTITHSITSSLRMSWSTSPIPSRRWPSGIACCGPAESST
jgi:hypothetical protein